MITKSTARQMMLTLSSMPTAILREDIPLISGVQDAETSAIFQRVFCRISISELLRRKLERMGRMCLRFGLVNVFFYRHSN